MPSLSSPSAFAPTPNTVIGPAPEQTTLQEEANQLYAQIESAHYALGLTVGLDQPSTPQGQSSMTLGAALRSSRDRMALLLDRLNDLNRYIGAA